LVPIGTLEKVAIKGFSKIYKSFGNTNSLLGQGVPEKTASVVGVKMFLAPFNSIEAIKATCEAEGYIPPLLRQGIDPVPSTQCSVSDTKLCQGLDVQLEVHINMNPPVLQLSKRNAKYNQWI
jgi:hypothetical protein